MLKCRYAIRFLSGYVDNRKKQGMPILLLEENLFRKISEYVRMWIESTVLVREKPRGLEVYKADVC